METTDLTVRCKSLEDCIRTLLACIKADGDVKPGALLQEAIAKANEVVGGNSEFSLFVTQPSVADAFKVGEKGSPHSETERDLFESFMRGHCWGHALWNSASEMYEDIQTRMQFAIWRSRGFLANGQEIGVSDGQDGMLIRDQIQRAAQDMRKIQQISGFSLSSLNEVIEALNKAD